MVKTPGEVEDIIQRYVQALRRYVRVEKVLLYGSYARGGPGEWSDIDLAVVSPDFGADRHRDLLLLSRLRREADSAIEALPFSVDEHNTCVPGTMLHEIIRTGRVVYDASAVAETSETPAG